MIQIAKAHDRTPNSEHKTIRVTGLIDGEPFCVDVLPYCGEYHWHQTPSTMPQDDEPVQIAIGQHFEDNDIYVGRIGR